MEAAKTYREGLSRQERARNFEELRLLGGEDPYEEDPSSWNDNPSILLSISYPDIVYYLAYTQLKLLLLIIHLPYKKCAEQTCCQVSCPASPGSVWPATNAPFSLTIFLHSSP